MRTLMILLELTAFAILPIMLAVDGAVFAEEEIDGEEKALGEREFFMQNLEKRQRSECLYGWERERTETKEEDEEEANETSQVLLAFNLTDCNLVPK
ncbi:hypothetical protein PIB30_023394 [Stylosanthes scabra]|uniref:Uncharacterized protein n=1 Tax=Stylosanthes scabra TaxID=79078 RepID=A0ABU6WAK2_9FABA|nr:hypothetical protein [Stylosanthes scabra]